VTDSIFTLLWDGLRLKKTKGRDQSGESVLAGNNNNTPPTASPKKKHIRRYHGRRAVLIEAMTVS
jgi:hypothetical protein